VEQTKLAALGRLSASIAHEIRNPVGAMSHAAQLLDEAPGSTVRTAASPRSSATTPSA
jgi:two-component system, NtrC family, sensor histidine kinase PilS